MKRERDVDDKFGWDISAVMLILLILVGMVLLMMAIGPINHVR